MGIHPNAMLMAHLSPDDLPRKTLMAMLADAGSDADDAEVKIGEDKYHAFLTEGWDEGWQISGKEGEIVLMQMVTYGYGERIEWDALRSKANHLAAWIESNTDRYKLGGSRISVGANYW